MTRVVIVSEELGIYLGSFLGLGFWSKLDDAGQPSAVTFKSEIEAMQYAASWDNTPTDLRCVPVVPDDGEYASARACARALEHVREPVCRIGCINMVELLPPGFFYLCGKLCVRLPPPEGGWRVATELDKADCEAQMKRAREKNKVVS